MQRMPAMLTDRRSTISIIKTTSLIIKKAKITTIPFNFFLKQVIDILLKNKIKPQHWDFQILMYI